MSNRTGQYTEVVPTDDELVRGIRSTDEHDFNTLYERYFQRVYNFSFARLRNHADAEEAVQETFTSVFRSIEAFRGESSLVSWIYGIARNTVNNQLRRAKTQEQRMEQARPELMRNSGLDTYSPEDHLNLQRCADAIQEQLGSISEWQVEVFVLRHLENLTIGEIAKRVSRSNDSVRSSLYRVKRLLFEAVESNSATSFMPHVSPVRHLDGGLA